MAITSQDASWKSTCGRKFPFCWCNVDEMKRADPKMRERQSEVLLPLAAQDEEVLNELRQTPVSTSGHPFITALTLRTVGRSQEAQKVVKELQRLRSLRLEDLEECIPAVASKFSEVLCPFKPKELGFPIMERHPELPQLEYGVKVDEGIVQWYSICDYEDCDIVAGLAAYLEVDQTQTFYEDLVKAEELGKPSDTSTVWRMQTRNKAGEVCEDHVYRYEVVDALDMKLPSVLVLVWTPPEGSSQLRGGARVPPPAKGYVRSKFECNIYRFIPFSKSSCTGFRLVRSGISRPSGQLYRRIESLDDDSLRLSARDRNEKFMEQFKTHLSNSKLLTRIKASPRAAFYDRVRQRLQRPAKGRPQALAGGAVFPDTAKASPSSSCFKGLGRLCGCGA